VISITGSRPKPIIATWPATVPALITTTASTTFAADRHGHRQADPMVRDVSLFLHTFPDKATLGSEIRSL